MPFLFNCSCCYLYYCFFSDGNASGEDGVRGWDFDNPKSAFFVGNFVLSRYLLDGGMPDQNKHLPLALCAILISCYIGVCFQLRAVGILLRGVLDT